MVYMYRKKRIGDVKGNYKVYNAGGLLQDGFKTLDSAKRWIKKHFG